MALGMEERAADATGRLDVPRETSGSRGPLGPGQPSAPVDVPTGVTSGQPRPGAAAVVLMNPRPDPVAVLADPARWPAAMLSASRPTAAPAEHPCRP
jgi:hypothetical protein